MEIALQVRSRYSEVLAAARWAEAAGLVAFAMPDHYLSSSQDHSAPAWDHFVHLAGLARETETIELVDLVSPVTFRHPAVHAKMAVTVSDMSKRNGRPRFTLGLGAGWLVEEHTLFGIPFPARGSRFEMLDEQLAYLSALRKGESFDGDYYRLQKFDHHPAFDVPLLVGGSGPSRTPDLAGRYCDEFNLFPKPDDDLEKRIRRCHLAAGKAGRDPQLIKLSFVATPIAGLDEPTYRQVLEAVALEYDREPEALEERLAARRTPFGTPDRIKDRFLELEALGISRLYLQAGTTDLDELETRIRPYLEASRSN
ncbi:MAG TPA: LLM class flavin-dependent oxidoreductase [Acidimicrobiia bacterium]|nr:LLM class flavin-dependent oxidoreductase [Acidimicrobiia bacterium]